MLGPFFVSLVVVESEALCVHSTEDKVPEGDLSLYRLALPKLGQPRCKLAIGVAYSFVHFQWCPSIEVSGLRYHRSFAVENPSTDLSRPGNQKNPSTRLCSSTLPTVRSGCSSCRSPAEEKNLPVSSVRALE